MTITTRPHDTSPDQCWHLAEPLTSYQVDKVSEEAHKWLIRYFDRDPVTNKEDYGPTQRGARVFVALSCQCLTQRLQSPPNGKRARSRGPAAALASARPLKCIFIVAFSTTANVVLWHSLFTPA